MGRGGKGGIGFGGCMFDGRGVFACMTGLADHPRYLEYGEMASIMEIQDAIPREWYVPCPPHVPTE